MKTNNNSNDKTILAITAVFASLVVHVYARMTFIMRIMSITTRKQGSR